MRGLCYKIVTAWRLGLNFFSGSGVDLAEIERINNDDSLTEAEKEEQRAALQRNANAAAFNNCADPDDPNCQLADENAALSESQQEALKNTATNLQGAQSVAHVTAAENTPSEFDGPASQGTNIGVNFSTNF